MNSVLLAAALIICPLMCIGMMLMMRGQHKKDK